MGTGGSNPPFSAKKEDDAESSFFSGYGAVRLAHLLWEQGVEGSNPFAPTENQGVTRVCDSLFFGLFGNQDTKRTRFLEAIVQYYVSLPSIL